MLRPKTLAQYPQVVVRIDCARCPRQGSYRLVRLAARYGIERSLDEVLRDLAKDCPHEARCGARFMDLQQTAAPVVAARQRLPAREDVPHPPKSAAASSPGAKVPMLSDLRLSTLVVICPRCGRRDDHDIAALLERRGDIALVALLKILTRDCERWNAQSVYELCGARFEML